MSARFYAYTLRNHIPECYVFSWRSAYAPYATCMVTPLYNRLSFDGLCKAIVKRCKMNLGAVGMIHDLRRLILVSQSNMLLIYVNYCTSCMFQACREVAELSRTWRFAAGKRPESLATQHTAEAQLLFILHGCSCRCLICAVLWMMRGLTTSSKRIFSMQNTRGKPTDNHASN